MKRYYFELTDRSYNDLGAFIPDGYSKEVAVRQAKRWMAENSIVLATLIVNSLRTSNVLDVINIDILKTMKMTLIHDIVEIDAGDTYCYDEEGYKTKPDRESKAAERIFGMLPEDQYEELIGLWREFEDMKTPESKFACVLDRLQPILLNYSKGGVSWINHGVSREQVRNRNLCTKEGSDELYNYIMSIIDSAADEGMLKK